MLITTQKEFDNFLKLIKNTKEVAIDTEFYWMRSYYPDLCLVQILADNKTFLIDTLKKDIDFLPLKNIFENENIVKIFHSAENDIPIINNFFKCKIVNIFDTQIAGTILGFKLQISLKQLLEELNIAQIEKNEQFSDWRQRPLTSNQILYATSDVLYLSTLKNKLDNLMQKVEIQNIKLKDIFQEETKNLENINFLKANEGYSRMGDIQKYPIEVQKNIMKLANWREESSQIRNKPLNYTFSNKTLVNIAFENPKNISDFDKNDELKKLHIIVKKKTINALKNDKYLLNNYNFISKNESLSNKKATENDLKKVISYFSKLTKNINFDKSFISSNKNIKLLVYNLYKNDNYTDNKLLLGYRNKIVGEKLKKFILDMKNSVNCHVSQGCTTFF